MGTLIHIGSENVKKWHRGPRIWGQNGPKWVKMEVKGLVKGIFGVENVAIRGRNESVGLGGYGREKSDQNLG